MRRFAAVALLIAGVALPVCAQRAGARGGFSGHPTQGFHSGFTSPSPFRSPAPFRSSGDRFVAPMRFTAPSYSRMAPSYPRAGFGAANARQAYSRGGGSRRVVSYRRAVVFRHGIRVVTLVPVWGWSPFWSPFWGFSNSSFDTPMAYNADPPPADSSDVQPVEQQEPPPRSDYNASPAPAPVSENAVKLIFKDRRPSEEIHNYALTRTTLYVLDQRRRDIPVGEIDLAATEKVNRDAGVDFQFPAAWRQVE
ncbi:MAG TPA: hypothetical protein VHT28_07485 [Silvibacterium sp.]|nr:hypothetical protein [Silvibacterium sp.]